MRDDFHGVLGWASWFVERTSLGGTGILGWNGHPWVERASLPVISIYEAGKMPTPHKSSLNSAVPKQYFLALVCSQFSSHPYKSTNLSPFQPLDK